MNLETHARFQIEAPAPISGGGRLIFDAAAECELRIVKMLTERTRLVQIVPGSVNSYVTSHPDWQRDDDRNRRAQAAIELRDSVEAYAAAGAVFYQQKNVQGFWMGLQGQMIGDAIGEPWASVDDAVTALQYMADRYRK